MTRAVPGLREFEDLDEFFEDTDFATDLTLASGTRVTVIFDAESVEGTELGGPRAWLKTSVVKDEGIAKGDVVTIDDVSHEVAGVQPDGTGVTLLVLVRA